MLNFNFLQNNTDFKGFLLETSLLMTQLTEEQYAKYKIAVAAGRSMKGRPEEIQAKLKEFNEFRSVLDLSKDMWEDVPDNEQLEEKD